MKKSKRIYILLGVLVVACIATVAALKLEEWQEQIQNSEGIILELAAEDVQNLNWSYDETELSFTRDENAVWHWDEDAAFPVSEDKMNELLELFSSFGVSFIIEEVEDYSQYGLDDPVCTINLTTADQSYKLELGDFSKLDSQRYVSIGDGNAYLVSTDPMDTYEIVIDDIIENDDALDYGSITSIGLTGAEEWTIDFAEDSNDSVCADDVYFTGSQPLDTALVNDYLSTVKGVSFANYVSYNATEEELETYGLDDPELTITVNYTTGDEDEGEELVPGTYILHVSRDAEERAKAKEDTDEDETESTEEEDDYSAYIKVGDSKIIYEITSTSFESLMAVGYNDLRHNEVFTADFELVTSIDIELEGRSRSLTTRTNEKDENTLVWFYGDEEIEITGISADLGALSATEFTEEQPIGQQEIKLTLHLDHEYFPEIEIVLYRYDGTNCLATVNGESFALVSRSSVVDLIEAVNAIVLN